MTLFVLRLRNGSCVVVEAGDDAAARRRAKYADFNSSETDSKAEHVLYDALAQKHIDAWDDRDKRLVSYAVQQERGRLAK